MTIIVHEIKTESRRNEMESSVLLLIHFNVGRTPPHSSFCVVAYCCVRFLRSTPLHGIPLAIVPHSCCAFSFSVVSFIFNSFTYIPSFLFYFIIFYSIRFCSIHIVAFLQFLSFVTTPPSFHRIYDICIKMARQGVVKVLEKGLHRETGYAHYAVSESNR